MITVEATSTKSIVPVSRWCVWKSQRNVLMVFKTPKWPWNIGKNKAKKTRQWNNDLPADIDPAPAMDLPLLWLNTSCDWVPFMVKLLHFLHQNVTHPSCLLIWLRILKRFFWVWGGRLTRWLRKTWGNPQMPQSYGKPIKFARVSKFSEGF